MSRRALGSCLLWMVVAPLIVGICGATSIAAETDAKKRRDKNYYTVNETNHKKLSEALERLQAEDYDGALEVLAPMAKRSDRLKPYARALVFQLLGHLESSRERYPEALDYLEKCLAEDAMPYEAQISTRFNVAQVYLVIDRYAEAVRSLNLWFEEADSPNSIAYYLLAVSYYQLGEIESALPPAEKAVAIATTPQESWLQLVAGLYFETAAWEKAIDPLEQLVTRYSKKSYWVQLSALYAQQDRAEEALAVLQLAYTQELLERDAELTQLAKLYLHHGLPLRAALVLEKGLADDVVESNTESWELLANSWLLAREHERAVEPLAEAAGLAEDGDLYVRLAQVYLERDEWGLASKALENAVKKAGLRDSGHVNLLLGIAFYNQKLPDRARKHFVVAQSSESSGAAAGQWLAVLEQQN